MGIKHKLNKKHIYMAPEDKANLDTSAFQNAYVALQNDTGT